MKFESYYFSHVFLMNVFSWPTTKYWWTDQSKRWSNGARFSSFWFKSVRFDIIKNEIENVFINNRSVQQTRFEIISMRRWWKWNSKRHLFYSMKCLQCIGEQNSFSFSQLAGASHSLSLSRRRRIYKKRCISYSASLTSHCGHNTCSIYRICDGFSSIMIVPSSLDWLKYLRNDSTMS